MRLSKEAQDYLKNRDEFQKRITDEFGVYVWFLVGCVVTNSRVEKFFEERGLRTERTQTSQITFNTEVFGKRGKHYATISNGDIAFPEVVFWNKRDKKLAKEIAEDPLFMTPMEGVQRILDWHEVDGKIHILAKAIAIYPRFIEYTAEDVRKIVPKDLLTKLRH